MRPPNLPLVGLLRQLTHYHIADESAPVPQRMGVSYIWAGNGLYKYGRNAHTEAIVQLGAITTPGLPDLHPTIAWSGWVGPLPGALLTQALEAARAAYGPRPGGDGSVLVPIEAQFLVELDGLDPRLVQPAQTASPGRVSYQMEGRPYLVDIHSHHTMAPFFSLTDDHDDAWLSASVVLGRIHDDPPQILCRLNVYGDRQIIPAAWLFDDLGPFVDVGLSYELLNTAEAHAARGDAPGATTAQQAAWWGALVAKKITDDQLNVMEHDTDAAALLWLVSQALAGSAAPQAAAEGTDAPPLA